MKRTRIVLLSLFIIAFFAVSITHTIANTSHSIMDRLPEITALQDQFIHNLELLREYSKNRMHYFEKGLGWKVKGNYGFDTGNKSIFFSDTVAGIIFYSDNGTRIKQLSISYETEMVWINYGTLVQDEFDKPRICVGYKDNKPVSLFIILKDGTEYSYWETGYKVTYPQVHSHKSDNSQFGSFLPMFF